MTFVANEEGLRRLFSSTSPVGRHVVGKAQAVRAAAVIEAENIMWRQPGSIPDLIELSVEDGPFGVEATVGVKDQGKISRFLVAKEARERGWFSKAVREVFPYWLNT